MFEVKIIGNLDLAKSIENYNAKDEPIFGYDMAKCSIPFLVGTIINKAFLDHNLSEFPMVIKNATGATVAIVCGGIVAFKTVSYLLDKHNKNIASMELMQFNRILKSFEYKSSVSCLADAVILSVPYDENDEPILTNGAKDEDQCIVYLDKDGNLQAVLQRLDTSRRHPKNRYYILEDRELEFVKQEVKVEPKVKKLVKNSNN